VVGLGVLGDHAFADDPLLVIPGEGPLEEGCAGLLALAGEQFAVGKVVIIDRNVLLLPASAPASERAIAVDALAGSPEAAERFFVSTCKSSPGRARSWRGPRQAGAPGATQDLVHSG
jgi:hypothetical protein